MTSFARQVLRSTTTATYTSFLALLSCNLLAQSTLNYDPNHPTNTWDLVTNNWSGSLWTNTNDAIFGGTGETIDVDGNIIVRNLSFNSNSYVIADTNGTAGTLTFQNGSIVTVTNESDIAEIRENLQTSQWTKSGLGTLLLSGVNNITGPVTIDQGTLKLGNAQALGTTGTALNHVVGTNGTLDLNGYSLDISKTFLSFTGTLINTGATEGVIEGQVGPSASPNLAFTVDGSGDIRLSNVDRSTITKNGSGTLTLDGTDDNNAATLVVNEGLVLLAKTVNSSSRGLGSGLTIHGGIVRLTGTNGDQIYLGVSPTINGNGILDLNGKNESLNILQGNGGRVVNDAVGTTSTLSIGENNGTGAYHGVIANNTGTGGTLALRKIGRGTQTLTHQQTYTGLTTIENGGLNLDFANASGSASPTNILNAATSLTINSNGNHNVATLSLVGESGIANSQTLNGLTIQGGGRSRIILTAGVGGSMDLHVGTITHNVGSLADFQIGPNANIYTTNANQILSGRATVNNGEAFAQILGGKIAAYYGNLVYSTGIAIPQLSGYSTSSRMLIDNTSSGRILLADSVNPQVLDSILITDTSERVLDVGVGRTLQLGSNGNLLRNNSAGTFHVGERPNEGFLTAGTSNNGWLMMSNANAAGDLFINSQIKNTTGGALLVYVSGTSGARTHFTADNTYTGATNIHGGNILRISSNTALGTTATGTTLGENATLELTGNITIGTESLSIWGQGVGNQGALRNISGDNTYGGNITVTTAAGRISSDSGTLTLDVASGNAITAGNMEFFFSGAGNIVVKDSITQGGTSNNNIYKEGAGTLTLAASNTFTGTGAFIIRNNGRVIAQHNNALGGNTGRTQIESGSTLELQNSINVTENITINNTSGQSNQGAIVSGSGNNAITGTVTVDNGNTRINANSSANLTISNGSNAAIIGDPTDNSARQVTFGGDGDITIGSGGIRNGTGANSALSVVKDGLGTFTLSGNNTYTGTTTLSFGKTVLDYTSNNNNKLADSALLTLGQTSLELKNGSHSEIVGSTQLLAGTRSVIQRTSGTSTLHLNSINVATGSSLSIEGGNFVTTDNTNVHGILGGWATINQSDWAMNSTNAADGLITAYTGYTDISRLGGVIANQENANLRVVESGSTSGNITLQSAVTQVNTLLMSAAGSVAPSQTPATIDLTGKTLKTGVSGGIMVAANANGLTIGTAVNGGNLTAGGSTTNTQATLALINHSTANEFIINSAITDNGTGAVTVTHSGAGTVVLKGTNTFKGGLVSTGGTLKAVGSAQALGDGTLTLADTTLHLVNDVNTDFNRATILNGDATIVIDRITAGAGVTHKLDALTFNESVNLTVLKGDNITSGLARLEFDGRHTTGLIAKPIHSSFHLGDDVELTLSGSVNSGSAQYGNFTKSGSGKLILDGSRSYWENINIYLLEGKLEVRNAVALGDDGPANGAIHASNNTEVKLVNNANSNYMSPLRVVGDHSEATLIIDRATASAASHHTLDNLELANNTLHVKSGSNITSGKGSITFSGTSTISGNSMIDADSADVHIANVVSGHGAKLIKQGASLLSLASDNLYTGGTEVVQGTLQVRNTTGGSGTGTGDVLIRSGATLNGNGKVGHFIQTQDITVEALAFLQVGTTSKLSSGTAGQLTLATGGEGQIRLLGTTEIDLFGNNGTTNPTSNHDVLVLESEKSVELSGALVISDVTNTSTTWQAGSSWQIIDWTGVEAIDHNLGSFSSIDLPTLSADVFWDTSQLYTTGVIFISIVPEPSRVLFVGTALCAMMLRRRRKI